jgi:hypothetical protein
MTTTSTRPAWQGTHTSDVIITVWRRAAALIQQDGYNPFQISRVDGEPYTMVTAIERAARDCESDMTLSAGELEDDAAARLAGVMRLAGMVTYEDANATTLDLWDSQRPAHTAGDAVGVLGLAVMLACATGGATLSA